MTSEQNGSGARPLVALVLVGLLGFCGYVGYRKFAKPTAVSASSEADSRVQAFLRKGYQQLDAQQTDAALEQFQKASGIDEQNSEVLEALAEAFAAKAERTALDARLSTTGHSMLAQLEKQVDRARQALEAARQPAAAARQHRLLRRERQLNWLLLQAYQQHGKQQRARGVLEARLKDHPQYTQLKMWLAKTTAATTGSAAPNGSALPTAGSASAAATPASSVTPTGAATSAVAERSATRSGATRPGSGHFEFDNEPDVSGIAGKKELQLPTSPKPAPAANDLP